MSTILVVEDESGIARLVEDYLEAAGFTVMLASTAGDPMARARLRSSSSTSAFPIATDSTSRASCGASPRCRS